MNKHPVFAAVASCLISVALAQNSTEPANHGIVVANMDRSVKPGDDFYQYANGGWIKHTELPPNRSYIDPYGIEFSVCVSPAERPEPRNYRHRDGVRRAHG